MIFMKIRKVPNIRSIILCMLLSLPMCMVCGSNAMKGQKYSQTASCDKTGHSLKDDVCQRCGHGFFSYRTKSGKIVTLNNKDFGANIVSHSVVNGECTIECDGPITKIPDNAFSSKGLKGELLRIPRTVTYIGTRAFYNNKELSGLLIIPNSVTEIGERAFYMCGFNGSLTLSNNLTKIGNSAFSNCGFTGNLTIPNSVTEIGPYAFNNCVGFNGKLTLSDNLKTIGEGAFYNCNKLKAPIITFPATLENIGTDVFYSVTSIKSVKFQSLPQGINNIKQKDVILNDASFISDQATGTVNNISYSRTITPTWGTLVLPYSLTLTGNEPYSLYAIESISTDELVLSRLNGEVAAGTPCMVKRNGEQEEMTFTANNATLNMTIQPIAVKGLNFQGTYHAKEVNNGYIIRNGLLWNVAKLKAASPETAIMVGPFRSWLDGTTNGTAKLSIRVDDSATGIDDPISSLNADDVEYYDLNGRRLTAPQQGINIMKRGNKTMKVIIK